MNNRNIAKELNKIYRDEPNISDNEAMRIIEGLKRSKSNKDENKNNNNDENKNDNNNENKNEMYAMLLNRVYRENPGISEKEAMNIVKAYYKSYKMNNINNENNSLNMNLYKMENKSNNKIAELYDYIYKKYPRISNNEADKMVNKILMRGEDINKIEKENNKEIHTENYRNNKKDNNEDLLENNNKLMIKIDSVLLKLMKKINIKEDIIDKVLKQGLREKRDIVIGIIKIKNNMGDELDFEKIKNKIESLEMKNKECKECKINNMQNKLKKNKNCMGKVIEWRENNPWREIIGNDYEIVDVGGSGDCFFYAIGTVLNKTPEDLRRELSEDYQEGDVERLLEVFNHIDYCKNENPFYTSYETREERDELMGIYKLTDIEDESERITRLSCEIIKDILRSRNSLNMLKQIVKRPANKGFTYFLRKNEKQYNVTIRYWAEEMGINKLLLKYKKYRFISLASDRLVVETLSDFYRTEREELDEKVFVLLLHIRSGGGHYQVLRNKVSKELELKYNELPELVKEEFNREVVRN